MSLGESVCVFVSNEMKILFTRVVISVDITYCQIRCEDYVNGWNLEVFMASS
jgi:hypothetical protein